MDSPQGWTYCLELFAKYAGTEVKLDGDEYLVIRETDLLAIVTNGKK